MFVRTRGQFEVAWLVMLTSSWVCVAGESSGSAARAQNTSGAASHGDTFTSQFLEGIGRLLKQKCLACHGDDAADLKGGFDLQSQKSAFKGGDSGEAGIVPGKPEASQLYLAVTRQDPALAMPPKENDKLSPAEVELVREWIANGAPWPEQPNGLTQGGEGSSQDGVTVATRGGRSPDWTNRRYDPTDLWAWQSIQRPAVPRVGSSEWSAENAIDDFIAEKLLARGVNRPAAMADRRTLIRRATYDLTGLAPSPAATAAFLNDDAPDAFERLIEGLLGSPQYGEQMARHWLDVVRYADTSGFSNDFERPQAWRYRDYIVRSFNRDKRFDQFLLEQLAGDEIDATDPELLIATGFLRMGPWEHTSMTVAALTRQQYLDDITHSVGVALLGQGLRCASCHDHKFDPIPTQDYYRMQALFATTHFAERAAGFLPQENTTSFGPERESAKRRLAEVRQALAQLKQINQKAVAALLAERGVTRFEDLPPASRERRDTVGLSRQQLTLKKVLEGRAEHIERGLQRYEPLAFAVYSGDPNDYRTNSLKNRMPQENAGVIPVVRTLLGGSLESPAEEVSPGMLSAMSACGGKALRDEHSSLGKDVAGRRLGLARWIIDPENTLTARVIVNRVWQWHFGTGLVRTPNNFGKMGSRPTHPELLDWLAAWFIDQGWSLKELHRLIMSSATYRQSGERVDRDHLHEIDSRNELLAYFPSRRLAAEEIRDGMLSVTGELNLEMGGGGVFPEINWEVALQPRNIMGSVAPAYQPSPTRAARNRRTLYAFRIRTLPDPFLEVFNRPGSDLSCDRRDETTITPQACALLNSQFALHRSLALATALDRQSHDLAKQIDEAFRRVYGRPARDEERRLGVEHVRRLTELHRHRPPVRTELPQRVTRHRVEELTGEDTSWDEELDLLQSYERDIEPWDVSPETRALADLCLVLFNSNEFLYVR